MKKRSLLGKFQSKTSENTTSPQLTSLIDAMTILLIFLIQNFSAQGDFITTQADITIPHSQITTAPLPAAIVQITETEVRFQGVFVIKNDEFAQNYDLVIPQLYERLKTDGREKRIIIEADKNLPFNVIKRVSFTCSEAGFEEFEILVDRNL